MDLRRGDDERREDLWGGDVDRTTEVRPRSSVKEGRARREQLDDVVGAEEVVGVVVVTGVVTGTSLAVLDAEPPEVSARYVM